MSAKHTQGPWEALGNLVRSSMVPPAGVPRGVQIAECRDSYFLPHSDEAKANARLIAAAPDLLEACQAAWNCIAELTPTQARVEVAQLLQGAVEKATGAAP